MNDVVTGGAALLVRSPVQAQVRRDGDRWVVTIGKRRFTAAMHDAAQTLLFQGITEAIRQWAEAPGVPESLN